MLFASNGKMRALVIHVLSCVMSGHEGVLTSDAKSKAMSPNMPMNVAW
jgi:hypothetical protein